MALEIVDQIAMRWAVLPVLVGASAYWMCACVISSKHVDSPGVETSAVERSDAAAKSGDGESPSGAAQYFLSRDLSGPLPDGTLDDLAPSDQSILESRFLSEDNLRQKATLGLAALKFKNFDLLSKELIDTIDGVRNEGVESVEDYSALHAFIWQLGVTAMDSDDALRYLMAHANASEWSMAKSWSEQLQLPNNLHLVLPLSSLSALGISMRQEALDFLEEMRQREEFSDNGYLPGGIVDAYFAYDMMRIHGLDKELAFASEDHHSSPRYSDWAKESERGRELKSWYRRVSGLE